MSEESIRIVIADDHPIFRDGLTALLETTPDVTVVAEATTGVEAIECSVEQQPDVVIMDLQMPEMNGIEAIRQIATDSPHVGILVLTMFDDDESVFAAMRAGALGYLLKGAVTPGLIRHLVHVAVPAREVAAFVDLENEFGKRVWRNCARGQAR